MKQINIFNFGNGWSNGAGSVNKLNSTKNDTKWKKNIFLHPDNMYRSWADHIASRIDAKIYHIGRHNTSPTSTINLFNSSLDFIKKKHANDMNYYFLNIGVPPVLSDYNNEPIDDAIDSIVEETLKISILLQKLIEMIPGNFDETNRLLVVTPDNRKYKSILKSQGENLVSIEFLKREENNNRIWFLEKDLISNIIVPQGHNGFPSHEQHEIIGSAIYKVLTTDTDFLII